MQQQQQQQQQQQSQQQQPQQPPGQPRKGTPGRRRQNRHPIHSPAHKTYASENDMPTELPASMTFAVGSPFTPQKSASNSPAPQSQSGYSKSRSRNGNKPRPKDVSTSPKPVKPGRTTPPYSAAPKSSTATAFAGATFHASPNPSSLPIPSFLARAMGSPDRKDNGRISQEPSPPATDSDTPTPKHQSSASISDARDESPLDFFFAADRAEKERARRASSAAIHVPFATPGPYSPPRPESSQVSKTAPHPHEPTTHQSRRAAFQRSSSGISASELDGTPGRPLGPAFSTPYHERIRAARPSEKQVLVPQQNGLQLQPSPSQSQSDRGEALMKFLQSGLSDHDGDSSTTGIVPAGQGDDCAVPQLQHIAVSNSTPMIENNSPDLRRMEDSLRRILKLDSAISISAAPAATAAATSYRSS